MTRRAAGRRGRHLVAALCLLPVMVLPDAAAADPALQLLDDGGAVLAQLPMREGAEICLRWSHSVTGGAVADCFENRAGQLTLTRSFLHDFAAGLGEVAGRGRLVSAPRGGYWIVDINEAMPANSLNLRNGSDRVGHILAAAGQELPLSDYVARGARVSLHLNLHP